ncbi:uncharacterized protein LOC119667818 [Teleopsis dalmanni]|uniref:uncharacterized protein LOC119667818 n=1 Tax=Teleopsis dalmanni TaxID=139649 RepID=UPI0018CF315D|nr:uncharacterized protein LOC119667818 [Teleopsis dalmanni]XP_037933082.1 uncharacterized protein LOC119667818 [Teleopsis dalmanni]XP_037933083.1 uncharacterized protein LOC119667818 [Teleopsis dalmanni]XP_037933085.1 uncharacterized protein LOC119667818 [Teleopsis dalmanni]
MDIMDIQAVESKLSDVTVTPIPRSQVQNFYYQQQKEQREQQPQIQISAIHHTPRDSSQHNSNNSSSVRDFYSKRDRDYLQQSSSTVLSAAAAATALQYSQQLQAQLALLQQQSNTTATPASRSCNGSGVNGSSQSQHKYPQSNSPVIITTQTSANITTPMTSTANLPTVSSSGINNGLSKYAQLLAVIEEMGRDIRPTYTGSRSSTERLKRGIVHARILVRECLMETERSARQ